MTKKRKRLLYDLSPIPESVTEPIAGYEYDLEIRVIFNKSVIEEIHTVKSSFSIGTDMRTDYSFDESIFNEEVFELVSRAGDGGVLKLRENFKGYLMIGEERENISSYVSSGRKEFVIGKNSFAVVEFGKISIVAMMTPKGKLRAAPLLSNMETTVSTILFLTFVAGILGINSILELPPIEAVIYDPPEIVIKYDPDNNKNDPVIKKKKVKLKPKKGMAHAETTKKSKGDEGRVGKEDSRVANSIGSSRKRIADEKIAAEGGILGAITDGAKSLETVFGGGSLGASLEKNLGMVSGITGADMFGSGGLGLRGHKTGGGGTALAIGGVGTSGKGSGNNQYGMGSSKKLSKKRCKITAGGGGAIMMGSLDKALIDSYVKRNLARIRACYEKELNKNPNMFGKIVVSFKIKKSGRVGFSNVKISTMGNENVEKCVAGKIKKIRFPEPKGGGVVFVKYPFVFKSSGAS